jgi:hypothetical protein
MKDKHPDENPDFNPDSEPDTEMYNAMYDPFGADFDSVNTSTVCNSKVVYVRAPSDVVTSRFFLIFAILSFSVQVAILLKVYNLL